MTRRAVLIENRRDVVIKRGRRRPLTAGEHNRARGNPKTQPPAPNPQTPTPNLQPLTSNPFLVREPVHDVVDAELVGLVGVVDGTEPGAGPFPELRDIGVVVDDHLQPLGWIV